MSPEPHWSGRRPDQGGNTGGGGGNGGGAAGPLLHVDGTLNPAQIKTLNTSPTQIVAGVPGSVVVPKMATFVYVFNTVAYTAGGHLCLATAEHVTDALLTLSGSGGSFGGMTDTQSGVMSGGDGSNDRLTSWSGLGLCIACLDADFADGNGTLNYSVYYEIVATS